MAPLEQARVKGAGQLEDGAEVPGMSCRWLKPASGPSGCYTHKHPEEVSLLNSHCYKERHLLLAEK